MNALIIGPVWPEPSSSAAGYHLLAILETLVNQGWHVTFASAAQKSPFTHDIESMGILCKEVKLNDDSFDHWVKQLNPKIVIFDRFMVEEQFSWRVQQQCPNAIRVLNMEDLHSLRHQREKQKKQFPDISSFLSVDELLCRELASIYRSDLSLVISDVEMKMLTEQMGVPPNMLHYTPFWIKDNPSRLRTYHERNGFIFIGNFLHKPNWDAVQYLISDIWPTLYSRLVRPTLEIYGAYAADKAYALNNPKKGIHVKGRADNVDAVMSAAKVCLAPIRFGAGLKGKLLDAMRVGTPNVTTWIGAEGMTTSSQWPGFIANRPEHFIDAAVTLYQSESIWNQAQQAGIRLLTDKFDWTQHQTSFINAIEAIQSNIDAHRAQLSIQQMFNHHLHKSTTYMSRWIEAKEKVKTLEAAPNQDN